MQDLRDRACAHPDFPGLGPEFRERDVIGDVDEREQRVSQRRPTGDGDRVPRHFRQRIPQSVLAVPLQGDGLPGIARNGANDVLADPGIGGRRDAATNAVDARQALRQPAHHRRSEDGKARNPREDIYTRGLRPRVESLHASDKFRAIRQIEVVHAGAEAALDDAVAGFAVGLERAAGVDENVRPERTYPAFDVAIAIKQGRLQRCRRAGSRGAEGSRFLHRATGDDQRQARRRLQQIDDAAAEGSVAADDQDSQSRAHPRNLARSSGPGRKQDSLAPNHLRRFFAMTS